MQEDTRSNWTAFIIALLFFFIFTGAGIKILVLDPLEKEKRRTQIISLTRRYFDRKEYETAYNFIQPLVLEDQSDPEVLGLLDEIIKALNEDDNLKDLARIEREEKYFQRMMGMLQDFIRIQNKTNRESLLKDLYAHYARKEEVDRVVGSMRGQSQGAPEELEIIDPQVAEFVSKGIKAFEAAEYAEAKNFFSLALKIDRKNAYANAYLGASLFQENPESEDNIAEAVVVCKKALEKDTTLSIAHFTLANIYYQKNMFDAAIDSYEEVVKINPLDYGAHYQMGTIYYKKEDFERARSCFVNSIKGKTDYVQSYYFLALTEMDLNNSRGAIESLEKVITLDGSFYNAYTKLGDIYWSEQNYLSAVDLYERANKIEKNYHYLYKIAECYRQLAQNEKAARNYIAAIDLNPGISDADIDFILETYKTVISLKREDGKNHEALSIAKKGIDRLPGDSSYLIFLAGEICRDLKQNDEAIIYYNKVLDSDNNSVEKERVYYSLGLCYLSLDNNKMSVTCFEKAIQINPDFSDGYYKLGEYYFNKGLYRKARPVLLALIEKKPDYDNIDSIKNMLSSMDR